MIPGLVYFLVVSEPIFHTAYTEFIKNILEDNITTIYRKKNNMIRSLKNGVSQLLLFQGVWTIGLVMNTENFLWLDFLLDPFQFPNFVKFIQEYSQAVVWH